MIDKKYNVYCMHYTKLQINGPSGHCSHLDFHPPPTLTLFDSICCEKCHTPLRPQAKNVMKYIFFTLGSVLRLPYCCIVIFTLLYFDDLSNKIIQSKTVCAHSN